MTDTTDVGNQLRLDLLREALPYIRRFKGKTFVVKLSGKVTEDRLRLIDVDDFIPAPQNTDSGAAEDDRVGQRQRT